MSDKPRRFFGLLCAHEWEHWGTQTKTYESGTKIERPTLRCKHCGDAKVAFQ